MKKRILGLALALVMIISLLPLTALAAEPVVMPKVTVKDPAGNAYSRGITEVVYIVFEDVEGGNKPVVATEEPADNFIKFAFDPATNVLDIVFQNVNYKRAASGVGTFITVSTNTSNTITYSGEYDIVLTLIGTNTLSGEAGNELSFQNTGDLTITGSGSLTVDTSISGGSIINKTTPGDLTIKNTTLTLTNTYTAASCGNIVCDGNVIIDGSNLTIYTAKCYGIVTAKKYNTSAANFDTNKGVTIKSGSNVLIDGIANPDGTVACSGSNLIKTYGPLVFENSTIELHKGEGNRTPIFPNAPEIKGTHSEILYKKAIKNEWTDYSDTGFNAGDEIPADTATSFRHFKSVHECAAGADDGDCTTPVTCACGKAAVAAKEHAGVVIDCKQDTMCTNEGCTKVYKAAAADHVAGADDGDCTTPVKCANCDQIVVEAKTHTGGTATCTALAKCDNCGKEYGELAAHTVSRTDCSVEGVCSVCTQVIYQAGQHSGGTATCKELAKCEFCGKEYGELAAHKGGTATCKDKAKCEVCGVEYGELVACVPADDDGNCTTAIKCSVCGKELVAAKEHKYTDNKDTACDNEGCTHTRKVEAAGSENENPKTGDNTALVLFATLMVASAAAFVCTKKFAVR